MKHIFRAMGLSTDFSSRQKFLVEFCKTNSSFKDFRSIQTNSKSRFWSGSQIPVIEAEISTLKESIQALNGLLFLEHRAYLEQQIAFLEKEKKDVLLDEFLKEIQ